MSSTAQLHFVQQQGFKQAPPAECPTRYSSLMFQPRVIGAIVLVGLVTQAWPLFLILSAVLWWNVIVPSLNPFDALYNRAIARPKGRPRVSPAPPPRRFAQGMAATFMLGIGLSLLAGWSTLAWILEGFLVVALAALVFGKFCLGSYLFHLIRGDVRFAQRTLPWAHDE